VAGIMLAVSSITLTANPQTFPAGQAIAAYKLSDQGGAGPQQGVAPQGSSVATATLDAGGTATLTGLTDGVDYVAYGQVSGVWKYVRFSMRQDPSSQANATAWSTGGVYTVGQLVTYNGQLYAVITAHTAGGSFDSTKFSSQSSSGAIKAWTTATAYILGQAVTSGGNTYLAVDAHTSGATFVGDSAHWALQPLANKADALPVKKFRVRRPALTPISTFQSGHGWTINGTGNSQAANTTDPYVPDQGTKVSLGAAGNLGQFVSPGNFSPTKDFSSKVGSQSALAIAGRMSKKTDFALAGQVFMGDGTGQVGMANLGGASFGLPDGEYSLMPIQRDATGTPNLAAIQYIGINLQASATKTPTFDAGEVATWQTDGVARVVVFLDDSTSDQYEMARRAIAKGVKVCVAVIPGELGNAGYLTVAQALDLQNNYGVEFVFHARTIAEHNNTSLYQDPVAFEANLKGGRDLLIQYGLTSGIEHHCCAPCWAGQRDDAQGKAAGAIVDKYFPGLIRTAMSGFNSDVESQAPFGNEKRIRTGLYSQGTNSALSNLQSYLNRCGFIDGVAVLVFHQLNATDSGLLISRATFDSFMTEIVTARAAAAGGYSGLILTPCTFTEAFAA
jgi:hypothetical protein